MNKFILSFIITISTICNSFGNELPYSISKNNEDYYYDYTPIAYPIYISIYVAVIYTENFPPVAGNIFNPSEYNNSIQRNASIIDKLFNYYTPFTPGNFELGNLSSEDNILVSISPTNLYISEHYSGTIQIGTNHYTVKQILNK